MIERVSLDNLWTFVGFEWRPGPLAILLGANGAGKSALLEALTRLQRFLVGETSSLEAFDEPTRTRWERRREQRLELDVRGNGGLYRYRLRIEHDEREAGKNRVASESLRYDDRILIQLKAGKLRMFRDNGGPGPHAKADPTRSGIGAIGSDDETRLVSWFKDWLFQVWLLRPEPRAMTARIGDAGADRLEPDLSNFAAWYVRRLAVSPGFMHRAENALRQALPGFLELHRREGHLWARFGDETASESFRFDELSDGQRALIALYGLRHALPAQGHTLALDDPDHHVSLREIQPWLMELTDLALAKDGPQIWIISHHPEVLDLLAADHGWRLFREGTGPTRIERFRPAAGLDPAETVARGWDTA